ncbi:MAG: HesA/MoeB/ThiF family protein, partial [Planctomycetaceae bacterium]
MSMESRNLSRYERQMVFAPLGLAGQRTLLGRKALIVGVGGLGSWVSELLARAGVGLLRLVDDDTVQMSNIHRQAMYDMADAANGTPKVLAAAQRLRRMNDQTVIETRQDRLTKDNIARLAAGMDLIIDGSDNFAARFLVNDWSVKTGTPWIFAGVVGAEAQTMTIVPPGACLRCVSDTPPPPCVDPSCRIAGVLGPAVAAIAAIEALEAMKILSGNVESASPYLTKIDL